MFDELRRLDWLPRGVRQRATAYRNTHDELTMCLGRVPASEEVLSQLSLSEHAAASVASDVHTAQLLHFGRVSEADEPASGGPFIEHLVAGDDSAADHWILAREQLTQLRDALDQLEERHRTVVHLRFFAGWSQAEVGESLGVSNSRICQIESRAISDLRRFIASEDRGLSAYAMDARKTERGTLADSALAQARVPQAGTCCSLT